jgi:hypothetical protein
MGVSCKTGSFAMQRSVPIKEDLVEPSSKQFISALLNHF